MKTNGLVFWILGLISLILSLGCLSADSGEGYVFIIAILGSQLSIIIIALGFIIANQEKKRDKDNPDEPLEKTDEDKKE